MPGHRGAPHLPPWVCGECGCARGRASRRAPARRGGVAALAPVGVFPLSGVPPASLTVGGGFCVRIAWRAGDSPGQVSAAVSGALGHAPRGSAAGPLCSYARPSLGCAPFPATASSSSGDGSPPIFVTVFPVVCAPPPQRSRPPLRQSAVAGGRARGCVIAGPQRCAVQGACGVRGVGLLSARAAPDLCVCARLRLPPPPFLGGSERDAELLPHPTCSLFLRLRRAAAPSASDITKAWAAIP